MKHASIKVKLTGWYLLLTLLMMAIVLGFVAGITSYVVRQTSMDQLEGVVENNLQALSFVDGSLQVGEDFSFYQNGVYTVVYSQNQTLLAGQMPVNFTEMGQFQNGTTRLLSDGETDYFVLDFWRPFGWENGVWVRGVMQAPAYLAVLEGLLVLVAVAMPVFLLLSSFGGYCIAKRTFRPLDEMIATANSITEGADLSARILVKSTSQEWILLANTLNAMLGRLETSFEAEKQFTSDASHELRTPISVIKSACDYSLSFDETMEERTESLTMIQRQADKMAALVEQLLRMTRLDQGTERLHLEWTNLSLWLDKVCRQVPLAKTTLHLQLEENLFGWVDVGLMGQLVQNLLENGVKYGKEEGNLWVRLQKKEDGLLLTVEDDGIGIAKEQQEKIWQRFYQVDEARSGGNGFGLGLSLVQKIAHLHGGFLTLESCLGKGSAFTLHLPFQTE